MRNTFIDTIVTASANQDNIFIISGDAGFGVFDVFKETYPDRYINLGVAEQNMISLAAGLSMSGYKVLVYNIIPFLLYRCYEQVRNDICYQNNPIVLIGIGSGITYAPMGMTHYSVEDIGLVQTLPNLVTISPIDPIEAKLAALYALESDKPVYVRLAKRGEPIFHSNENFNITLPQVLKDGRDTAIIFHGSISNEVMTAYDMLLKRGYSPLLISIPMIQPLNKNALIDLLAPVQNVICVEEHFTTCGLGSIISQLKNEYSASWGLKILGIPPEYIHQIRNTEGLRTDFEISAINIARSFELNTKGN